MREQYPVSILGSCVTRDPFASIPCDDFKLVNYTARTSLASLACKPHFDVALLGQIKSKFQRNMVERDMRKSFWEAFGKDGSRLLILDLIDDRFDLAIFADMGANTLSAEYKKVRAATSCRYKKIIASRSSRYVDLWKRGYERLSNLANHYDIRVIVNAVYYVPTGNQKVDTIAGLDAANEYLQGRYHDIGGSDHITYGPGELEADPAHKWGIASFHYSTKTYDVFFSKLRALAGH